MSTHRIAHFVWITLNLAAASTAVCGAQLRFTILEEDSSQPVPCRIHLKDAAGRAVRAPSLPFWHDHFVCPGEAELNVTSGRYTYEIDRGPEFRVVSGTVTVSETGSSTVTERLHRLATLSREGWWSGELHVHRPLSEIELLMRAEDLHVAPVITWWNNQNPWRDKALPANPLVRFDGDRFYQVVAGEDERAGGALLFFNLDQPLPITGAGREHPSPMTFLTEARQRPNAWIEIEKPFWYDAPVWLASGMVDSIGIAHNHMQRGGVMANEAWGRPRDKARYPDPQGNGFWTQDIYYHALNCGLRIPPTAGSASGVLPNPVGYNRVYVHVNGELDYARWFEGLKAGLVFVSNGPLLRCRANGEWPGHVFKAAEGQTLSIELEAKLDSRDSIHELEIVKDGRVVQTAPVTQKTSGRLAKVDFSESGWFLVRAIADVPGTFRFASTGPFYVEIGSTPRRISRTSAQFFLDWVRERMSNVDESDAARKEEVLKFHRQAEQFWTEKVKQATAD